MSNSGSDMDVEWVDEAEASELGLSSDEQNELFEVDPEPHSINFSGTDFDVEGLVRRLERGDIVIPSFGIDDETIETAGFQRDFVWTRPQMDRFIESLLLEYPIPGIFLVQQRDRRYLVLDGQQRLRTLAAYYKGMHEGREFRLKNVSAQFQGLLYEDLDETTRRKLDNSFIPATIVQTDGSRDSLEAVYQVFERLNSGGTQLTAHEIRVALYAGPIIEFVSSLNLLDEWRELYGGRSKRLRDQELVLRIIALYVSPGTYRRPLKSFLNDFAGTHRYLDDLNSDRLQEQFRQAARLVLEGPGSQGLRYGGRGLTAALTEAVFVGLMRRLETSPRPNPADVSTALDRFLAREGVADAVTRATADEDSVRLRLAEATREFSNI